ncbi:P-loop containing nucleoside triphosphate hydrolase protein [Pleomassaria siparia CBS 279.74]|uniref:P-loop containing nucleoside triphosphate hydrolase protein n=1 Tax=Pleomassaria siparia CBS 279.74 TaxID=1314801 RepID=A0A6G1K196_9PLEO|nr:P-loop containing nucleoside triphosphate hydrolase protein [Pleomassaria siparia CBS 279.74]
MTSLPINPQYICSTCIRQLSRLNSRHSLTNTQSSHYATSTTSRIKARKDSNPSRPIDTTRLRSRALYSSIPGRSIKPRLNAPLRRTKRLDQEEPERLRVLRNNKVAGIYKRVFPWDAINPGKAPSEDVEKLLKPPVPEGTPIRKQHVDTHTAGVLEPSAPTVFKPVKPVPHWQLQNGKMESWNWYWETLPPSLALTLEASRFFTKESTAQFLRSVAKFRYFPESDVPEVAFVGRSNVGKSSLLNAIVNADVKELLARTSSTPGFTKAMNLYGIGGADGIRIRKGKNNGHDKIVGIRGLVIVDMPGYGEGSLAEWGAEIMKYVQNRKQLRRVFVLIDAQHGIKDKDRSLLASLRLAGVSHQVIMSKLDKVYLPDAKSLEQYYKKTPLVPTGSREDLSRRMDEVKAEIQPQRGGSALGELLACSSEALVDGRLLGIDSIRFAMLQAVGHHFSSNKKRIQQVVGHQFAFAEKRMQQTIEGRIKESLGIQGSNK